jgi:hypothetical protein
MIQRATQQAAFVGLPMDAGGHAYAHAKQQVLLE